MLINRFALTSPLQSGVEDKQNETQPSSVRESSFQTLGAQTLAKYPGSPSLSKLSNVMLRAIHGNSTLNEAQVICFTDYHLDLNQKFIRTQMINEILVSRGSPKNVHILVEGIEGIPIEKEEIEELQYIYERLIGNNLIHPPHSVQGWDNKELLLLHLYLIREIQELGILQKDSTRTLESLKIRLAETSEKDHEKIDLLSTSIKNVIETLHQVKKNISDAVDASVAIAKLRNNDLYESIRKITKLDPNAIVVVIAGRLHFENISQAINDLSHCILETRKADNQLQGFEHLDALYGSIQ